MHLAANEIHMKRIIFLDHLRGIAVLLVVWSHIFLVGINDYKTISVWVPTIKGPLFGAEAPTTNVHGLINLFFAVNFGLSAGELGVALFFLLSGFVILKTIDSVNPVDFLVRRFFRIVPLNAFVVLCVATGFSLYLHYEGLTSPHSMESVIVSSLALNWFFQTFQVLPVLWTLEAEIAFYLVIAVISATTVRIDFRTLILTSSTCLTFIVGVNSKTLTALLPPSTVNVLIHLSTLLIHITFMLVGATIYRATSSKQHISGALWVITSFLLCVASYSSYKILSGGLAIGYDLPDMLASLIIFVLAIFLALQGAWLRPLKFFGDISYPLYLVHVPLGWWLLSQFSDLGFGMYVSALASSSICIVIAWGLHFWVELPSQQFGKRLGKFRGATAVVRS